MPHAPRRRSDGEGLARRAPSSACLNPAAEEARREGVLLRSRESSIAAAAARHAKDKLHCYDRYFVPPPHAVLSPIRAHHSYISMGDFPSIPAHMVGTVPRRTASIREAKP